MWARFTEQTRRAVYFAQQEAGKSESWHMSAVHLMLGILRAEEQPNVAQVVLKGLGHDPAELYQVIQGMAPRDGERRTDMELTRDAKRTIDLAFEESRRLNINSIGTEQMLLGILAVDKKIASLLPTDIIEQIRAAVVNLQP